MAKIESSDGRSSSGSASSKRAFDLAEGEDEEVGQGEGSSGLDRFLAVAAAVVALLSAASTYLAYTSVVK
ncbi:MAG: hypothetical protein EBS01_08265 [Verrucomicrobia bacterium]|nr:hypothetical protein [Verrucomicrobiota bacterium]